MMDTILGIPLEQLLSKIKVPRDTEDALMGKQNHLRATLDLIIAYDRGNWERTKTLCSNLNIEHDTLADEYMRSAQWVDMILGMGDEQVASTAPQIVESSTGNGLRPM
jgi:EAL and modified HD-GYP domain-containing signal transduction protein